MYGANQTGAMSTRNAAGGSAPTGTGASSTANTYSATFTSTRNQKPDVPAADWERKYTDFQAGGSRPGASSSTRSYAGGFPSSMPEGDINQAAQPGFASTRPKNTSSFYNPLSAQRSGQLTQSQSYTQAGGATNSTRDSSSVYAKLDSRSQQAFDSGMIPGSVGGVKGSNLAKGSQNPFIPHVTTIIDSATERGVNPDFAEQKRVELVHLVMRESQGGQIVAYCLRKRMKAPDNVVVLNSITLLDELMRTCPFFYRYIANDLFFRRMWRFVDPNYKESFKSLFLWKTATNYGWQGDGEDLPREITVRCLILLKAWAEELQRMFRGKRMDPAGAFIIERYNNKRQKVRFPLVPESSSPWICPLSGKLEAAKNRDRNADDIEIDMDSLTLVEVENMVGLLESILDNTTDVQNDLVKNEIAVDLSKRLRIIGSKMDDLVAKISADAEISRALDISERIGRAMRDYDSSVLLNQVVREASAPVVEFDDVSSNQSLQRNGSAYEFGGVGGGVYAAGPPRGDYEQEGRGYEPDHGAPPYAEPYAPPPIDAGPAAPYSGVQPMFATVPGPGPNVMEHEEHLEQLPAAQRSRESDGKGRKATSSSKATKKKKKSSRRRRDSSEDEDSSEEESSEEDEASESSDSEDSEEERRRARKKKAAVKAKSKRGGGKASRNEQGSTSEKAMASQMSQLNMGANTGPQPHPFQQSVMPDPYAAALFAMYSSQLSNAAAYQSMNPNAYHTVNAQAYRTVNPATIYHAGQNHPQQQANAYGYGTSAAPNPASSAAAMAAAAAAYQSMNAAYHTQQQQHQQAPPVQYNTQAPPPPPPAQGPNGSAPPAPPILTSGMPPPPIMPGAGPEAGRPIDTAAAMAAYQSFLQMYASGAPPPQPPQPPQVPQPGSTSLHGSSPAEAVGQAAGATQGEFEPPKDVAPPQ
ncbi:hypothetical protein FVE85_6058 [Porphyridium purpureum]|uniref:VHS domain-containing protein n=1 Tax=Porphyridium purpureum TaxID=35688 RepID=A0A5J4Z6L8_PORPP|nr:hypothetical protein FVE85_6058 [Porphyridium purpureum]|eukprot:POR3500..scf295_1